MVERNRVVLKTRQLLTDSDHNDKNLLVKNVDFK